jgi:NAD(P)-dependent dehydrogenase (short-subunit alcohol dehydrogenase family)
MAIAKIFYKLYHLPMMDLRIQDRVALVTGSGRGIGKAIARQLLKEGASVVLNGRSEEVLSKAEAELSKDGPVFAVAADVTDDDDVSHLVDQAIKKFGGIDILINNAGILGSERTFHELSLAEWKQVYDVNLWGVVRMTQAVLPHMREQGWGRIVNIASEAGTQPDAFKPHYDSSKAALINFTKNISKTYGEEGVLVNAVSPATTLTPLVSEMFRQRAEADGKTIDEVREQFVREERPTVVLNRLAEPEEVADIATFLASERASYVTGSNYRVDGGSIHTIDN